MKKVSFSIKKQILCLFIFLGIYPIFEYTVKLVKYNWIDQSKIEKKLVFEGKKISTEIFNYEENFSDFTYSKNEDNSFFKIISSLYQDQLYPVHITYGVNDWNNPCSEIIEEYFENKYGFRVRVILKDWSLVFDSSDYGILGDFDDDVHTDWYTYEINKYENDPDIQKSMTGKIRFYRLHIYNVKNPFNKYYCSVPLYDSYGLQGVVLLSKTVNEYLFFQDIANYISLFDLISIKEIVFYLGITLYFIFFIIIPITKLSKQTSSVLDKTGKITTTEFAYKKRRDEIGDLSRSFSTLIKKINDQMQAVESNTSDMVHEFKNPLAAIRSSMELLDFDDVSGEERKEILDSVHSELKHLEILLNDIRTHSKIQNLNNEADKENVPVGILAENIISRIRKNYPSVNFEFICENKEDTIFAKPENLDKMIGNLVENAASFAVNSEKKQVLVRIKSIKDIHKIKTIMRIDVEDSGPGVPENEIEKIFGRYYSHREDSQRKSHSGLGLSMVKAVADSLNATISVLKSGKLGGAKFVVSIPLFDEVEEIRK